jgi:hypothetical protein
MIHIERYESITGRIYYIIILCITRASSCTTGDVGRTTIITICPFTRGRRRLKRYTISVARIGR